MLLKSAKELVSDPQYSGELTIKLTTCMCGLRPSLSIWGVMLEKWPNKEHENLKYMYNVRLAAERVSGTGWITYDEQFRLMKARFPTSTWLIYVATHEKPKLTVGQTFNNAYDFQNIGSYNGNRAQSSGFRACWGFNRGNCQFGRNCRFARKCTTCFRPHPQTKCRKGSIRRHKLAKSPIRFYKVEESLINYPRKYEAIELIEGLKHGFPLKYSGTRLPFNTKNLRSVYERPDLVKTNIKKEVSLFRVAGPFTFRPFPTLRVSPIGIVPKKDGDFRIIHHLSHPTHNFVNDFIAS